MLEQKKEENAKSAFSSFTNIGAEDGIRTRDPRLGKAMLYP
jgi:hypothetical protein